MDKITILIPGQPSMTHELTHDVTTIGRRPDNNIVIADSAVSAHHAIIVKDESGFRVEDLNSTNGTYVGGLWVRRKELQDGDKVRFALVEGVFETEPTIVIQAPAAPAQVPAAAAPPKAAAPAMPAIPKMPAPAVPSLTKAPPASIPSPNATPPSTGRPVGPPMYRPPVAGSASPARPPMPAPTAVRSPATTPPANGPAPAQTIVARPAPVTPPAPQTPTPPNALPKPPKPLGAKMAA